MKQCSVAKLNNLFYTFIDANISLTEYEPLLTELPNE